MKAFAVLVAAGLVGLIGGCVDGGGAGQAAGHRVEGRVLAEGKPVAAAKVSLANGAGIPASTETGSQGQFAFSGVPDGQYELQVEKQIETGQVMGTTQGLSVSGDLDLQALLLPAPPTLKEMQPERADSAFLEWESFGDPAGFREYKLYRKADPGIDESHGDLVFVGTRLPDTAFSDDLSLFEKDVYYRLFVMNEFGRAGGSNVLKRAIPYDMARFFPNASFEQGDADWSLYDAFKTPIWANFVDSAHYWLAAIDTGTASAGKRSLRLTFGKGRALTYGGLYTTTTRGVTGLKPGKAYRASYMLRFASCKATAVKVMLVSGDGSATYDMGVSPTEGNGREWRKVTADFTTSAEIGQYVNTIQIDFGRYGTGDFEGEEFRDDTAWVDDIQIHPLP